jgi:hypothetical protein
MSRPRLLPLRVLLAVLLFGSALPLAAFAQAVDVDAVTPEPSDQPYTFFSGYDHLFETDIKSNGQVARDSFNVGIGGRFALGESVGFTPRFTYELNSYDFTSGAQPFHWDYINQYTLLGLFDWKMNENWSLIGAPILRLAGEGAASFHNGTSLGALLGFNYAANKDLSLGLALGVLSQIEDDPAIIPIPTIRWHFADAFTFRTGITQLGGRSGLGPDLTWSVNEQIDIGVGAQYQRRRFRLDDHGGFDKKAVGTDTSAPLYLKLAFHPVPAATIELVSGVVVAGEMRIQDKNGNNTFDRSYDATPMLGLRGEYRF